MFIAAPFTIATLWNQPTCQSPDEWIKKMCCIHTMEFYSAIEKNTTGICRKMAGTREHHVTWNKPDSERQMSHVLSYAESRCLNKNDTSVRWG
jgi:hypothetical protein